MTTAKTPDSPGVPLLLRPLLRLPAPVVFKLVQAMKPKTAAYPPYGTAAPADKVAHDTAVVAGIGTPVLTSVAQSRAIARYSIPEAAVRGLTVPALVLHGDQDLSVPYDAGVRLHQLVPGSELVTFHGAGHNYFVAAGDEANAAALDFLRRTDAVQAEPAAS